MEWKDPGKPFISQEINTPNIQRTQKTQQENNQIGKWAKDLN